MTRKLLKSDNKRQDATSVKPTRRTAKPALAKRELKSVADLTPDNANVNIGTPRGNAMLEWSLSELGAGRSILVDKRGVVIAGNKTLEVAALKDFPIKVIETDGRELVVVQRVDLDLSGDERARQLAIADNRVSEVNYAPDVETLLKHAQQVDLSALYSETDVDALLKRLDKDVADAPDDFSAPDDSVEHSCPKCGYQWRD